MILLPTLNRLEKLQNFLSSAMAAETTSPGLILVDSDDLSRHEKAYSDLVKPEGWEIFETKAVSMGDKCREVWPRVENEDHVTLVNDDHYVVSKHWDKILEKAAGTQNFSSANDRWRAPTIATTATCWAVPLLKAVGWPIYPPQLQHLYIDDLWTQLGRHTGCWRVCMNAVVEHHHVLNGRGKDDETHHKVYDEYFAGKSKDHSIFEMIMKHDFADAVKKIQDFQNILPGQRYNPDTYK